MMRIIAVLFLLFSHATISAQEMNLKEFVPPGYSILDTARGDLNSDNYADYVMILKNEAETTYPDTARPLLIIHGKQNGKYVLVERNDSIVFCLGCGGIFGDPYEGISVKGNYFSIEHYGGSAWRWTRIITFRYNRYTDKYMLHKDTGESFHVSIPNQIKYEVYNKKKWGKVEFEKYNPDW